MATCNVALIIVTVFFILLTRVISSYISYQSQTEGCQFCSVTCDDVPPPANSPLINCSYLPEEFLSCEQPEDLKNNVTRLEELGYGCLKFGGQKYAEVNKTSVLCTVLKGIECYGNRTFLRGEVPCIKYSRHYFATTLIYSVLLGFIGLDRFCLGHTGTAVGKLLTLGGVGIWWIVDIILLVTGGLMPADGSNWQPYA